MVFFLNHQTVLVLDFGGQYNQLIARRVRECGVYCEVKSYKTPLEEIKRMKPVGIIFTGGPNSAYLEDSPHISREIFELGIPVLDLNATGPLTLYVDGADECDPYKRLIKGGGAALTREKIVAAASEKFVCIIDSSKRVELLGKFPVPIEVIPMARSLIGREVVKRGGHPVWRDGVVTDNGNWIIDVHGWQIVDPAALESELNQLPGIVTVGLFARRPADVVLVGDREM